MRRTLPKTTAIFVAIALSAGCMTSTPSGPVHKQTLADGRTKLDPEAALAMINAYRRQKGLATLALDPKLMAAAAAHSTDMARRNHMTHKGADGSNVMARVRRTGYGPRLAAENVAAGYDTAADVMRGWKRSPGHDRNLLLAGARHAGIAAVYAPKTKYKTFWTLVLATPKSGGRFASVGSLWQF